MSKFLSKTNLSYAIEVKLRLENAVQQNKKYSEQEKRRYEDLFQEFYENDLKTGFYIHTDDESNQTYDDDGAKKEGVQFFNYNTKNQWWYIDEKNNNSIVLFNQNGNVIEDFKDINFDQFFEIVQFRDRYQLLTQFYKNYDYFLVMIYSKEKGNKQVLENIAKEIEQTSKSWVSPITPHITFIQQEETTYFRISVFFSKLDFILKEDQKPTVQQPIEQLIAKLQQLENKYEVLIFPTIVKEEIKEVIKSDFNENLVNILEYAQNHRYECLYDSESDDESDDSDSDEEEEEEEQEEGVGEDIQDDDSDSENNTQENNYVVKQ